MDLEKAKDIVRKSNNLKKGALNYGEYSANVNGVKVIVYNPSPLDRIVNAAKYANKERVVEQKKMTYVQEINSRKNIENILSNLLRKEEDEEDKETGHN